MEFHPAKSLEMGEGIEGISANWKMPPGETEISIETKTNGGKSGFIAEIADTVLVFLLDKRDSSPRGSFTHACLDFLVGWEDRRRARRYSAVWDSLVQENPELAQVQVDRSNSRSLGHAITGCTSQFNVSDINFFLQHRAPESRTGEYATLRETLEGGKDIEMQWVPSPETMRKILQAVTEKENAAAQAQQPEMASSLWRERVENRGMKPGAETERRSGQTSEALSL